MPSLIGDTIARNFEKAVETSLLGTRQLSFYKVTAVHSAAAVDFSKANLAGTGVYTTASSPFAKAIIALQGFVELYYVGTPKADSGVSAFIFAVATDTANGAEASSNAYALTFGAAEAAIKAAIGADTSATITALAIAIDGASLA
jgi:hypothetical protein